MGRDAPSHFMAIPVVSSLVKMTYLVLGGMLLLAACQCDGATFRRTPMPRGYQIVDNGVKTLFAAGFSSPDLRRGSFRNYDKSLMWSAEAESIVLNELRAQQFPSDCREAQLLVFPDMWKFGVGSQLRDFVGLVYNAQAFGRTVVVRNTTSRYCGKEPWLTCFVSSFSSCYRDPSLTAPAARLSNTMKFIEDFKSEKRQISSGAANGVVRLPLFPSTLWKALQQSGSIWLQSGEGHKELFPPFSVIRSNQDHWFLHMTAFLRVMAWKYLIPFRPEFVEIAAKALPQDPARPMIAIHLRTTDKRKDANFAARLPQRYDERLVAAALRHIEGRTNVTFNSIFVMSDDWNAVNAVRKAKKKLRNPDMDVLDLDFNTLWEDLPYKAMFARCGHECVLPRFTPHQREVFHRHFFKELWVASKADYLLGAGSSGVSQAISHLIGARLGVDPETRAFWFEDLLGITAPVARNAL